MVVETLVGKVSSVCRWQLLQSFCFDDDVFLCLVRGCGEKYFLFVSENSKINDIFEFEELRTAQEHFSSLFDELSKNKHVERVILSG